MPASRTTTKAMDRGGSQTGPDWLRAIKRTYLLDFQMPNSADQMPLGQPPNLRDIDPQRSVRQLRDRGADALYVPRLDAHSIVVLT
jgi:hypothetical protein